MLVPSIFCIIGFYHGSSWKLPWKLPLLPASATSMEAGRSFHGSCGSFHGSGRSFHRSFHRSTRKLPSMEASVDASTMSMEVVYYFRGNFFYGSFHGIVAACTGSLEYFHESCRHPCGSNFPGSFGLLPWKFYSSLPFNSHSLCMETRGSFR